jgi:hypothetical protein
MGQFFLLTHPPNYEAPTDFRYLTYLHPSSLLLRPCPRNPHPTRCTRADDEDARSSQTTHADLGSWNLSYRAGVILLNDKSGHWVSECRRHHSESEQCDDRPQWFFNYQHLRGGHRLSGRHSDRRIALRSSQCNRAQWADHRLRPRRSRSKKGVRRITLNRAEPTICLHSSLPERQPRFRVRPLAESLDFRQHSPE